MTVFNPFVVLPISSGNILDDINILFWVIFGVLALIGLIARISSGTLFSGNKKKDSEPSINSYLFTRIEQAGHRNNILKNDALLAPMGFIGAISDEKELLKSQSRSLSLRFGIPEVLVRNYIDEAYRNVYNTYIEKPIY